MKPSEVVVLLSAWRGMINRCESPKNKQYKDWGGRGIKVCDRWKDFDLFVEDVGPRPSPEYQLDRIDNDGDYEPGNVRWATRAEQSRNRRSTRLITINGRTMCQKDWAIENGISEEAVRQRVVRGWDPVRAVTQPPRHTGV